MFRAIEHMFSSPNIRLLHMYLALFNKTSFSSNFSVVLIENAMNRMKIRTRVMRTIYIYFFILQRVDAPDHFHTCRIQPNNTEKRSAHMVPREYAPHCTKPHCHQSVALLLTAHVSRRCNARDKKKFESCFLCSKGFRVILNANWFYPAFSEPGVKFCKLLTKIDCRSSVSPVLDSLLHSAMAKL